VNAVSRVPERSELALQAALEYAVASPSAELTLVMRAASACLPACLPSCLAKSGGEAGPVTQKRLNERRSRVAVEKGAALSSTIFGGQGVRMAPRDLPSPSASTFAGRGLRSPPVVLKVSMMSECSGQPSSDDYGSNDST